MDMIGRLNAEKVLKLGGVGTSPNFVPLVNELKSEIRVKQDSSGMDASDHTSFYLKDIPVLFAFTGQHDDYHKASDDVDKINFDGEVLVLEYLAKAIQVLDNQPKQTFQLTKSNQQKSGGFKVTMGVMPDYVFEGKGMRIDGVTDGKPAFKAGLKKGDVVIKLGEDEVKDVMGYMQVLSKYKKGDATTVTVKRGEEEKTLNVTF
jgi:membrane-associated protease RseP (regulator of RpoE activity)